MYSMFTYIWLLYGVNVGKYSIHGAYGIVIWILLLILYNSLNYYIIYIYLHICHVYILSGAQAEGHQEVFAPPIAT